MPKFTAPTIEPKFLKRVQAADVRNETPAFQRQAAKPTPTKAKALFKTIAKLFR